MNQFSEFVIEFQILYLTVKPDVLLTGSLLFGRLKSLEIQSGIFGGMKSPSRFFFISEERIEHGVPYRNVYRFLFIEKRTLPRNLLFFCFFTFPVFKFKINFTPKKIIFSKSTIKLIIRHNEPQHFRDH